MAKDRSSVGPAVRAADSIQQYRSPIILILLANMKRG